MIRISTKIFYSECRKHRTYLIPYTKNHFNKPAFTQMTNQFKQVC